MQKKWIYSALFNLVSTAKTDQQLRLIKAGGDYHRPAMLGSAGVLVSVLERHPDFAAAFARDLNVDVDELKAKLSGLVESTYFRKPASS